MDKTIINLVSILVGGAGIFVVLTKYYVPELDMAFLDMHPYQIKRHIIDDVMTRIFTCLAIAGLIIKASGEIFAGDLPDRIYTPISYVIVLAAGVVVMWVFVIMLINAGEVISKKSWMPKIIESQQELFHSALFIIENDGWREDQLPRKDTLTNIDMYRNANFETANNRLQQIEKLLELQPPNKDLRVRVEILRPYFMKNNY